MKDEHFFELACNELKAGNIRPGLRAKAFSDANGEESRAKALYLKYRVAQLIEEELEVLRATSEAEIELKKQKRDAEEAAREARVKAEGLTSVHFILIGLLALVLSLIIWNFFREHESTYSQSFEPKSNQDKKWARIESKT